MFIPSKPNLSFGYLGVWILGPAPPPRHTQHQNFQTLHKMAQINAYSGPSVSVDSDALIKISTGNLLEKKTNNNNPHINGTMQFKPLLLQGQLSSLSTLEEMTSFCTCVICFDLFTNTFGDFCQLIHGLFPFLKLTRNMW